MQCATSDLQDMDDTLCCCQLLMPGDKHDVSEFSESAVANTQLHLDLNIPNVSVFLPDRDFFEVLYNRYK